MVTTMRLLLIALVFSAVVHAEYYQNNTLGLQCTSGQAPGWSNGYFSTCVDTGGGGSGNVVGPGSSVANNLPSFADTTGKLLQDSGVAAPTISTVNTTTATVTTLVTVAIASNTTALIRTNVVGRRTGGSAGTTGDSGAFTRTVRCKNIAGTVTANDLFNDFTSRDQASWDVDVVASSTNCIIRVNGATNNNVSWTASTQSVVQ